MGSNHRKSHCLRGKLSSSKRARKHSLDIRSPPKDIQNFLELRAQLIRHTSDTLAQLAREKLLDARVPNFPVTDAIDALTIGTVNFLPKRIAEITTVFTAATESERQEILPRLQQILTARISSADLPIEFTDVIISMTKPKARAKSLNCSCLENGIVTLSVAGEFEVKLGIVNDSLSSPWHVYQTKLFLRDTEEPGKTPRLLSPVCVFSCNLLLFFAARTRTSASIASK